MQSYLVFVVVFILFGVMVMSAASAGEFKGYACTRDCSGHRAGYAWAVKRDIRRDGDCGGNSRSFREGCSARVAELSQEMGEIDERPPAEGTSEKGFSERVIKVR